MEQRFRFLKDVFVRPVLLAQSEGTSRPAHDTQRFVRYPKG